MVCKFCNGTHLKPVHREIIWECKLTSSFIILLCVNLTPYFYLSGHDPVFMLHYHQEFYAEINI